MPRCSAPRSTRTPTRTTPRITCAAWAHTPRFVAMLADIVRHATFPQDELSREREGAAAGSGRGRGRPDHRGLPVVRPCLLGGASGGATGDRPAPRRSSAARASNWPRTCSSTTRAPTSVVAAAGAIDPAAAILLASHRDRIRRHAARPAQRAARRRLSRWRHPRQAHGRRPPDAPR